MITALPEQPKPCCSRWCVSWVLLGYCATLPLGTVYGWSGHPAIPAAPFAVYVGLYLVALPVLCILAAWKVTRWVETRIRARHSA